MLRGELFTVITPIIDEFTMNLRRGPNRLSARSIREVVIPEQTLCMPKWDQKRKVMVIETQGSLDPVDPRSKYRHRLELSLPDIATLLHRLGEDGQDDAGQALFNLMQDDPKAKWSELLFRLLAISLGHEMYGLHHATKPAAKPQQPEK